MIDERERYERAFHQFQMPEPAWDRLVDRRDRKRRVKRITAGVVGIAVFVAAIWIVTSVGSLDRTQTPAVPGPTETGPMETGPTETGTAETGPKETADRGENPEPPPLVGAVQIGTVTRSGAGCELDLDAGPKIPAGPGRLTLVNETNRTTWFDLFRFDTEAMYRQFEASVATGTTYVLGRASRDLPTGAIAVNQRVVPPGASGTLVDRFTSGGAYAIVCARQGTNLPPVSRPIALVGPIAVR